MSLEKITRDASTRLEQDLHLVNTKVRGPESLLRNVRRGLVEHQISEMQREMGMMRGLCRGCGLHPTQCICHMEEDYDGF
jgi:hypothetical protein